MIRTATILVLTGLLALASGCASTSEYGRSNPRDGDGVASKTGGAISGVFHWIFEHDFLVRVRPWERDVLAREDMGWTPDVLRTARMSHIHFSKEASLIGGSAGGGCCGCN